MQGSRYLRELWDEPPIVPCKAKETFNLSYISQGRPFLDGFYFAFIGGYSLGRNNMPQVGNLPLEQLTFGWFELNPSCSSFWIMVSSLSRWLAGSFEKMTISSKEMMHQLSFKSPREVSINH